MALLANMFDVETIWPKLGWVVEAVWMESLVCMADLTFEMAWISGVPDDHGCRNGVLSGCCCGKCGGVDGRGSPQN